MGQEPAPRPGSTAGRARARTRARERMADKLAEQRRRERDVQDLLEGFLKTEDTIRKAADKRAAAIARADAEQAEAEESVRSERAAAVAAMRTLGQSVTDIADLTGVPVSQVRSLIQHARSADKEAAAATTNPGGESAAESPSPAGDTIGYTGSADTDGAAAAS